MAKNAKSYPLAWPTGRPRATVEEIQAAYRIAARKTHPDQGGSTEAIQRVNTARDAALSFRKEVK